MAIFNLSLERNIDSLVDFPVVGEINSLKKEMNHLFEFFTTTINSEVKGRAFIPAVEISEGNDAIDLKVEIPGLDAKDLDIQVTAEEVKIRGQRHQETTTEESGRTRSEFGYGAFERVISLPAAVQNQQVKADYKDGILHLHLPLAEPEKNRVVQVNID